MDEVTIAIIHVCTLLSELEDITELFKMLYAISHAYS